MTAAFFRGRSRRAAAALGAVTFGVVALSACDKPTPLTTLTVGKSEVHSEAACYNGKQGISEKDFEDCAKESGKTVKVNVDDDLHIGVDPKVAKKGWTAIINNRPTGPWSKTYRTIPVRNYLQSGMEEARVTIVMYGEGKPYGVWNYTLKNDS
ncbi:DUF2771 domain-containing protein [Streptomyces mobaraensis NBRC 13819 = DSM 40847]|uniref:DUF2771 domain-containing protein n=1 Tax=Streptomyces mobaraensis TaxID=35621 RepID=A0A5N5WHS7_STRMB|nr:hypothetical protein [Streptomyces mobaraensis]KAB7852691.1 DUF2771 domain-containing protein [Streptomyces mobaraensis]QTT75209.1 DUF2771 domain-containing protein [Streptomyces mobaraensis NBRC 13819 = DSM 40847]